MIEWWKDGVMEWYNDNDEMIKLCNYAMTDWHKWLVELWNDGMIE